jgi:hypothetical protein
MLNLNLSIGKNRFPAQCPSFSCWAILTPPVVKERRYIQLEKYMKRRNQNKRILQYFVQQLRSPMSGQHFQF